MARAAGIACLAISVAAGAVVRKIIGFGITGVVVLFLVYIVGGGFVFNQMLGRTLLVGQSTDLATAGQSDATPYDLAYRGDPQTAFGFAFSEVSVTTDIGEAPAWLVAPDGGGRDTWAIFVHGIAGTREGGYRYLPSLRAAGFPTLLITYRNDEGAPRSPEGLYSFGLTEWPDLDAAVAYALERGARDVIIAADSMGGGILGQFLKHSSRASHVRALLMDAPALDFTAVGQGIAENFNLPFSGLLVRAALEMFAMGQGVHLWSASVLPEIAAFTGPILLVHGSGDRIVPIAISEHLLQMRYGETVFLRTHADHLQSRAENPAHCDQVLRQFLSTL